MQALALNCRSAPFFSKTIGMCGGSMLAVESRGLDPQMKANTASARVL